MDAEAYPEAATNVLNILWDIGTGREVNQSSLWTRAREAAFRALLQYEVGVFDAFIASLGVLFCISAINLANTNLLIVNQVMVGPGDMTYLELNMLK